MDFKDAYPIPQMQKCLDSFDETCKCSRIDANFGYCKIEINDQDKENDVYVAPYTVPIFTNAVLS